MSFMEEFNFWLEDDYFDQSTKDELLAIRDNQAEIEERFYRELEFGTGGLRGIIGAGTNRMNVYTVRKATQGLANFILKQGTQEKGVAIAYDSRRMSPEFADVAGLCLAANGIKAYVFESLRPTPELSFALRTLGCTAGIVVTASHNPPEYNGYKACSLHYGSYRADAGYHLPILCYLAPLSLCLVRSSLPASLIFTACSFCLSLSLMLMVSGTLFPQACSYSTQAA